jgi:hypothetical protein
MAKVPLTGGVTFEKSDNLHLENPVQMPYLVCSLMECTINHCNFSMLSNVTVFQVVSKV